MNGVSSLYRTIVHFLPINTQAGKGLSARDTPLCPDSELPENVRLRKKKEKEERKERIRKKQEQIAKQKAACQRARELGLPGRGKTLIWVRQHCRISKSRSEFKSVLCRYFVDELNVEPAIAQREIEDYTNYWITFGIAYDVEVGGYFVFRTQSQLLLPQLDHPTSLWADVRKRLLELCEPLKGVITSVPIFHLIKDDDGGYWISAEALSGESELLSCFNRLKIQTDACHDELLAMACAVFMLRDEFAKFVGLVPEECCPPFVYDLESLDDKDRERVISKCLVLG